MVGEVLYNGMACEEGSIVENNVHFIDNPEMSQLVLTESAASCMLNQLAKSNLGKLDLNEERFN